MDVVVGDVVGGKKKNGYVSERFICYDYIIITSKRGKVVYGNIILAQDGIEKPAYSRLCISCAVLPTTTLVQYCCTLFPAANRRKHYLVPAMPSATSLHSSIMSVVRGCAMSEDKR